MNTNNNKCNGQRVTCLLALGMDHFVLRGGGGGGGGGLVIFLGFFSPSGCARFISWAISLCARFFKHQNHNNSRKRLLDFSPWLPLHDIFSAIFSVKECFLKITQHLPQINNGPFLKRPGSNHTKPQNNIQVQLTLRVTTKYTKDRKH